MLYIIIKLGKLSFNN